MGHARYVFVTTGDGVELWWQMEGSGPTVLLIPGRGDPTDVFPAEFSDALVAGSLSVLRWDTRDTGLSGAGGDTYTVATIAEDSIAVLDAARVEAAHVVGISMAGLVMAHLVSRHADRVRSLTFIAAMSPDPNAGVGEDFFGAADLDPTDRVAGLVRAMGETTIADRQWAAAAIAAGDTRAAHRPDAVVLHQEAAFRLDWPTMASFRSVQVPTLVVHGQLDRVLPIAHTEAIGAGIAAASVTIVDGMGHVPRLRDWIMIAERVTAESA